MLPLLLAFFQTNDPNFFVHRGEENFRQARIAASVADFDRAIELAPRAAPQLWQRGISLYYAKRWKDCRKQFETHRTVNPEDVENAVWHYLCVARIDGVDAARKLLIPIRADERIPMMEVYAMYRGESTPEKVLATARAGDPLEPDLNVRLFYAHLYIGLYLEAKGDAAAKEHIRLAAEKYKVKHYMWDVARVHLKLR